MAEAQEQGSWEDLWNFLRSGKTLKAEDISNVEGVQSALDMAKMANEPNSSDRTPDTVKAIPAFKNPYGGVDPTTLGPGGIPLNPSLMGTVPGQYDQPDAAKRPVYQPPEQVGKYSFDPMLIEGNKASKQTNSNLGPGGIPLHPSLLRGVPLHQSLILKPEQGTAPSSKPPVSKHSISSEKASFKAGSPTDQYLNKKIKTPEYLGMEETVTGGGPADETSPEPTASMPEASSAPTKSSDDFDLDKIMAEVQKLLNAPTNEKWDLSPGIAYADSISGGNVLKGYKRPQSREEILKERKDLALKLGELAEKRDYHRQLIKSKMKDDSLRLQWNEDNPDKLIGPNNQFFKKDDWMDKLMSFNAKAGIEGQMDEKKRAAQQERDDAERLRLDPDGSNGISVINGRVTRPGGLATKLPKSLSVTDINSYAKDTFFSIYDAAPSENKKSPNYAGDMRDLAEYKDRISKAADAALLAGQSPREAVRRVSQQIKQEHEEKKAAKKAEAQATAQAAASAKAAEEAKPNPIAQFFRDMVK